MSVTSTPSTTLSDVVQYLGKGSVVVTDSAGSIGFYGATPVVKPTLAANDVASVIAALVSLGLVTSA